MSPKKIPAPQKQMKTTVTLPAAIHARARQVAAGQSLSTWIAALVARETGQSKLYTPPRWGRLPQK